MRRLSMTLPRAPGLPKQSPGILATFQSSSTMLALPSRGQSVADTDPLEFERVMRVHAFGPHYMSKVALPHLRKRDRSDIVMISSVATMVHAPNGAPYNMARPPWNRSR